MTKTKLARTLREPAELVAVQLAPAEALPALERVAARYAVAIARQFVPTVAELEMQPGESADPIGDHPHSPVQGIVHRYPDRVLFKLVHVCAVYCRFCFRREMIGPDKPNALSPQKVARALDYIRTHPEIWEVILTGGDPLIL